MVLLPLACVCVAPVIILHTLQKEMRGRGVCVRVCVCVCVCVCVSVCVRIYITFSHLADTFVQSDVQGIEQSGYEQ